MKLAYLSLGSNLGDRERTLQSAIDALAAPDLRVLRLSPVYETEPMDVPGQPWFLNLVVEVETRLLPLQLLARASKVEHQLGRRRAVAKGPRTIDIDILFYGGFVISTAALTVPHPRLAERRFVLAPMADLTPGFRDPSTGRTISELLRDVPGQAVRKVAFTPVLRDLSS